MALSVLQPIPPTLFLFLLSLILAWKSKEQINDNLNVRDNPETVVKQSWEITWSDSCMHFPFLTAWILFLHNYALSEQDGTEQENCFHLYSCTVSIYCPRVTRKALGTCRWRQCQVCTADRAAGLDASFSSPSRPTVLGRHSLQGKYSSCPHFQMRLG